MGSDLPARGDVGAAMTVSISRMDLDAWDLRAAAGRSKDVAAARRMLALALGDGRPQPGAKRHVCRYGSADAAGLGASLQ